LVQERRDWTAEKLGLNAKLEQLSTDLQYERVLNGAVKEET